MAAEEAGKLREAIAAAAGSRVQDAKALRDKITDPAARKLVGWDLHRGGFGTAAEIRAFLDANPDWPDRGLLTQRAEEALFNANSGPRDIKAFFVNAEPRTAIGHGLLASAHLAEKDEAKAKALAQKAWIDLDMPAGIEPGFLEVGCRPAHRGDHKRRLDRLLHSDTRWTGERNERAAVIRRAIARRRRRRRRRRKPALPCSCAPRTRKSSSPSCRRIPRPTGASPCKRPRRCAARRRRRRPGRSCWPSRRRRCRQAGRLVGGAARQRLRGVETRQAEDGLRARAQSGDAVGQCRQGRLVPGRLAGAAPPQGRRAGARPFRATRQGRRRAAEPRAGPDTGSAAPTKRSATKPRPRSTIAPDRPI